MKYNVKFTPERRKDKTGNLITDNVPLFADIRFGGERLFYYTGFRVDFSKFNIETQTMKKNTMGKEGAKPVTASVINQRIKIIVSTLEIHFQNNKNTSKSIIKELLNDACKKAEKQEIQTENTLFTYFERYINSPDIKLIRKKHLKVTYKHLLSFAKTNTITFETITPEYLTDFKKYLANNQKGNNTISATFKQLRAFFNYAILNDWTNYYPFAKFKVEPEKYGAPIYITQAERDLIYNFNLTQYPKLIRVRDIFVFQCLIGARVGDMVKLTTDNIINGNLVYIANKTKDENPEPVTIPLGKKAKTILKKYKTTSGQLLPFITGQKYNEYLKELFKVVGITRNVQRINPTTGEPETVRICDIVSSHMARRTFVGSMHAKGVKNEVIASMSGHKKDSRAFSRYYEVEKKLKNDAIELID